MKMLDKDRRTYEVKTDKMTQALYAHMNNKTIIRKKRQRGLTPMEKFTLEGNMDISKSGREVHRLEIDMG
jgi:hypothetical protein